MVTPLEQLHAPADLVAQWRNEAALFRRRGALEAAATLEDCAATLEQWLDRDQAPDWITLAEAHRRSGYSVAHLRRLVAAGRLTSRRSGQDLQVRGSELPRKPGRRPGPDLVTPALAMHR